MPISQQLIDAHIQEWCPKAGRPFWPKYAFHYCHVTAAAEIMRTGQLSSRNIQSRIIHDVADGGAISTNPGALNYARLYFRPLTSFHLSTEGIKLRSDPYRRTVHMNIPVALLFDLRKILTLPGVGFSAGKLAHIGAGVFFDDAGFKKILFDDVYHDGPTGGRNKELNDRRMAEIIVPNALPLKDVLKFAVCRTQYDELTLRHFSESVPADVLSRIRVADRATDFFFCWGVFPQLIELNDRHILLKLFQGRNYKPGYKVRCRIEQEVGGRV
jgi:ssDNA thymidine ADP-ribosyltransferase, DarT